MVLSKISKWNHSETDSDNHAEKADTPFSNVIVLESVEEKPRTKLSPFVIEEFLSVNDSSKSVNISKTNKLVVDVVKK